MIFIWFPKLDWTTKPNFNLLNFPTYRNLCRSLKWNYTKRWFMHLWFKFLPVLSFDKLFWNSLTKSNQYIDKCWRLNFDPLDLESFPNWFHDVSNLLSILWGCFKFQWIYSFFSYLTWPCWIKCNLKTGMCAWESQTKTIKLMIIHAFIHLFSYQLNSEIETF